MNEYHEYKESGNPRLVGSCERCGRLPGHEVHLSLLGRVGTLRELYLDDEIDVEELAENLLDWRGESTPAENEGSLLIWRLLGFLTEFQVGECDERTTRLKIAETR